jgi:xanthine dehydrogenase molybdopterin-binding subunit B
MDGGHVTNVNCGNVAAGFAAAQHTLSGTVRMGAQEHFYMETQACLAVPEEDGFWTVHASCQGPSSLRMTLSSVLQIPGSRINCITKRAGGGFGGKITRAHPIGAAVAVAAKKLRRPVRMQLDRNADMMMTGKRHPYQNQYKVGFDDSGKISTLQVTFYSDGGYTHDCSLGCMDMTMMWADNAYHIPNYSIASHVCRTNSPSNTAARTPGAAQGIFTVECVLEHVAFAVGKPVDVSQSVSHTTLYRVERAEELPVQCALQY